MFAMRNEFGAEPEVAKGRMNRWSGAGAAGSRKRTVPSGAALVGLVEKYSRPALLCSTYCGRSEYEIGAETVMRILPVAGSRTSVSLNMKETRVRRRLFRSSFIPDALT